MDSEVCLFFLSISFFELSNSSLSNVDNKFKSSLVVFPVVSVVQECLVVTWVEYLTINNNNISISNSHISLSRKVV